MAHTPRQDDLFQAAPPGTHCVGCGYIVAGAPIDALCPECTTPVSVSMRGDILQNADPDYVRSLARGVALVIVGSIVTISWWVVTPVLMAVFVQQGLLSLGAATACIQSVDFLGAILMLAGWWLASAPNPAVVDPSRDVRTRRWLRWILSVIAVITAIGFLGVWVPAFANAGLFGISGNIQINRNTQIPPLLIVSMALRLTLVGARVLRFFVGLRYLQTLALRIPDAALHRAARRQVWLFPLLMTVGWAVVVGPLVGVVLYLSMLIRMQRAIARAAARTR